MFSVDNVGNSVDNLELADSFVWMKNRFGKSYSQNKKPDGYHRTLVLSKAKLAFQLESGSLVRD